MAASELRGNPDERERAALEEIDLLSEALIASVRAERTLSPEEIDSALGIDSPSDGPPPAAG